jgi:4-hydroxybenzoate polyprenyltransferase
VSHCKEYISIARPDHWIKNIFVLPGTFFAWVFTKQPFSWAVFAIGLVSVCLTASANYVMNEWCDRDFDKYHPVKKSRPAALGLLRREIVLAEYALVAVGGLALASIVSLWFFLTSVLLLVMGMLYNLEPIRAKDRLYVDVLVESLNNPIRFFLGWFIVVSSLIPPSSLVIGYWMTGAFLMAAKRIAEYRFIGDAARAGEYRKSFRSYNEQRLLVSLLYYAVAGSFFIGVFLIKYKVELILSLPFIALLFSWYLRLSFVPDSPAQHPERLFREWKLLVYLTAVSLLIAFLMVVDIAPLHWFLQKAFVIR